MRAKQVDGTTEASRVHCTRHVEQATKRVILSAAKNLRTRRPTRMAAPNSYVTSEQCICPCANGYSVAEILRCAQNDSDSCDIGANELGEEPLQKGLPQAPLSGDLKEDSALFRCRPLPKTFQIK